MNLFEEFRNFRGTIMDINKVPRLNTPSRLTEVLGTILIFIAFALLIISCVPEIADR